MITLILALLTATPATWPQVLAKAQPGDTVIASGVFATKIGLPATKPDLTTPRITLDLTGATVQWLVIANTSGWIIQGGDLGAGAPNMAVQMINADHVTMIGPYFHNYRTAGLSMQWSHMIDIESPVCAHNTGGDCIDVISSQDVQARNGRAWDLTYSAALGHTDLLQAYSVVGQPITARLTITGWWATCQCQGFDNYGNGDGLPIANVDIEDNHLAIDMVGAIDFLGVGGASKMLNNTLMTLSTMPKGWGGAQAVMTPAPGATATVSGNTNGAKP